MADQQIENNTESQNPRLTKKGKIDKRYTQEHKDKLKENLKKGRAKQLSYMAAGYKMSKEEARKAQEFYDDPESSDDEKFTVDQWLLFRRLQLEQAAKGKLLETPPTRVPMLDDDTYERIQNKAFKNLAKTNPEAAAFLEVRELDPTPEPLIPLPAIEQTAVVDHVLKMPPKPTQPIQIPKPAFVQKSRARFV